MSSLFVRLLGRREEVRIRLSPGDTVSIGRASGSDIRVREHQISRSHCQLIGRPAGVLVRDLGSRNGTTVNGVAVEDELLARPGDHVGVGRAFLVIERERPISRPMTNPKVSERRAKAVRSARPPTLPGYRLRSIGEGAIGYVYAARPERGGEEIAVKFLKPSGAASPERFVRAATVLKKLDHPNVVRVHQVASAGYHHYFTMELLYGSTLVQLTQTHPLGSREAMSIGIQVARALKLVHRQGLVHRDLAPRHIMLVHGGLAKLIGFDFSRLADAAGRAVTKIGDHVGEITYTAPEQVRDPRAVDRRADLYALGATLFHAVTGRPPFEGTQVEVLRKVISEKPPPLRALAPSVSPTLEAIVARLLEKDPDLRYQTGDDVEWALEAALLKACPARASMARSQEGAVHEHSTEPGLVPLHAFAGAFSGLELLEIVQFLEVNDKDGRLVVSAPETRGELHLRGGRIVSATTPDARGEQAVLGLLGVPEGMFEFFAGDLEEPDDLPDAERPFEIQPSSVALEVMRRRDEEARLVGSTDG